LAWNGAPSIANTSVFKAKKMFSLDQNAMQIIPAHFVMKLRQVKKVNLLFQSPINNAANSEPLPT
jgi:hypothetical protein